MKNPNVGDLPIMSAHCKMCPFKPQGRGIYDAELASTVTQRTLFKAQQICHGTEGKTRLPTHRCKGSFEYNAQIYERLGMPDLVEMLKNSHIQKGVQQ
ncbi:hypothetical protein [Runella salmonicolor]|uniref:Uncharacterized protein n=1 Tax=Runella salmonicolor TaxID=2950278 RepID=A0ABT1FSW7_9BACT|nr:hypothetical protein [Runella salmonicolor]MCP1384859.1 hypothetical protein [Runella salmonicolor]